MPAERSQRSVVQSFWSSKTGGVPAVHEPAASHTSTPLQGSPSEQVVPAVAGWCVGTWVIGSQASTVHGLPSSTGVQAGATQWPSPSQAFEGPSGVGQGVPAGRAACVTPTGAAQRSPVHGLPSSTTAAAPGWHEPPRQVSASVQTLPSSHASPSGFAGFEHARVAGLHVPGAWHWSGTGQLTGFEPTQPPPWHASLWVQALPSLHDVPSLAVGFEHAPLAGLQLPGAWHWSCAAQVTGFEPTQVPAWHVSLCVHALPSLHVVPSLAVGFEQAPVARLHVPGAWHWSCAAQITGLEPTQVPAWQVSFCVHALPSLHVVPLLAVGFEQAPVAGLHVPGAWHWSCAAQITGLEPTQVPAWQVSFCVHALPSLHVVPLLAVGFE